MSRYGMLNKIKKDKIEEYRKAHEKIWPEMLKALSDSGFKNYSIFTRNDGTLFSYFEHKNLSEGMKMLFEKEVNTKWQKYMDNYFIKKDKKISGPEYEELKEVFHMD